MITDREVDILFVEDTSEDLELTLQVLRKAGLADRIQIARDGSQALEFIFCEGEHAARRIEDAPRLVLLDLKLPKVSGLEVLRRMKGDARTKRIPIVMLTSSAEERDLIDAYDLGVNAYVVKPVDFDALAAAVQQLAMFWLQLNRVPL